MNTTRKEESDGIRNLADRSDDERSGGATRHPDRRLGWHAAAFCDWQPIRPHPVSPCAGGCGIEVDSSDGLCRYCRTSRVKADEWMDRSE